MAPNLKGDTLGTKHVKLKYVYNNNDDKETPLQTGQESLVLE